MDGEKNVDSDINEPVHDDQDGGQRRTFTQEDVDRIIRDRLARERKAIREHVLAEIKAQQEQEASLKRGEYEKILAQREQELREAQARAALVDEYEQLARERWAEVEKTLPEPIRLLVPEGASPLERERWFLTKALPAIKKLEAETTESGRHGLAPRDPEVLSRNGRERKKSEELAQNLRRIGLYDF